MTSIFALGSNVPQPLEWEDMSWEVRLSLASFLFSCGTISFRQPRSFDIDAETLLLTCLLHYRQCASFNFYQQLFYCAVKLCSASLPRRHRPPLSTWATVTSNLVPAGRRSHQKPPA